MMAPLVSTRMLPANAFRDDVVLIMSELPSMDRAFTTVFHKSGARAVHSTDIFGARDAFNDAERKDGPVTILINGPRVADEPQAAEFLELEGWRDMHRREFDAPLAACLEFARRRMDDKRGGSILNVLQSGASVGMPGYAARASAKAGLEGLTRTLAVEWAPYDIRVNALLLGIMAEEKTQNDASASIPAQRLCESHEAAWAASFLCSNYAAYITGASFAIDGGNGLRRGLSGPEFRPVREWGFGTP